MGHCAGCGGHLLVVITETLQQPQELDFKRYFLLRNKINTCFSYSNAVYTYIFLIRDILKTLWNVSPHYELNRMLTILT